MNTLYSVAIGMAAIIASAALMNAPPKPSDTESVSGCVICTCCEDPCFSIQGAIPHPNGVVSPSGCGVGSEGCPVTCNADDDLPIEPGAKAWDSDALDSIWVRASEGNGAELAEILADYPDNVRWHAPRSALQVTRCGRIIAHIPLAATQVASLQTFLAN